MTENKREKTMEYLSEIGLGAFRLIYDEALNHCIKGRKGTEDFLLELLEQEIAARKTSALRTRIKKARFAQLKDLDNCSG